MSIYCVDFGFLAQFRYHKPPYAYISVNLTRHYWAAVGTSTVGLLFTTIQPVMLCRPGKNGFITRENVATDLSPEKCTYSRSSNSLSWEITATVLDIITDALGEFQICL